MGGAATARPAADDIPAALSSFSQYWLVPPLSFEKACDSCLSRRIWVTASQDPGKNGVGSWNDGERRTWPVQGLDDGLQNRQRRCDIGNISKVGAQN
ncbi:hypothetical protein MKZ38_006546 [Zalerion maritima]|uniref:Uncharacterized protein n=1 Tax=Zalerion maritima TaxID=339359 RepID=A0AAD5RYU9_9PEZI|nr:hypothetical protein MKZ38_006546 [Zalerion maritima]